MQTYRKLFALLLISCIAMQSVHSWLFEPIDLLDKIAKESDKKIDWFIEKENNKYEKKINFWNWVKAKKESDRQKLLEFFGLLAPKDDLSTSTECDEYSQKKKNNLCKKLETVVVTEQPTETPQYYPTGTQKQSTNYEAQPTEAQAPCVQSNCIESNNNIVYKNEPAAVSYTPNTSNQPTVDSYTSNTSPCYECERKNPCQSTQNNNDNPCGVTEYEFIRQYPTSYDVRDDNVEGVRYFT